MRSLMMMLAALLTVWIPPLGYPLEISAAFDRPATEYSAGHRGIDIPASENAAVVAPAAGEVAFSGSVAGRPVITVRVDERTVYSFEPVTSELGAGDRVAAGELLGVVANGGHCAEACVHLGVRVDERYENPLRYFSRRPVLLPLG